MADLILLSASIVILLVLVILFVVGLYFSRGDNFEDGYCYFKYDYLVKTASHPNTIAIDKVVYAKAKRKDLRLYKTMKSCDYRGYRHDMSHVTWITRREYEEATK